jgi:hypothetical protein
MLQFCPLYLSPHRLVWSRTQAFQAWYMGSNPVGGTKQYIKPLPFSGEGFLCRASIGFVNHALVCANTLPIPGNKALTFATDFPASNSRYRADS